MHSDKIAINRLLLLSAALLAALACNSWGKIIYVDDDADGPGDGSSWQTAYKYLQEALADASTADKPVEIRVAQGIYKPDRGRGQTLGDRRATFRMLSKVDVLGGYAGVGSADPNARDIPKYKTILSGDLTGNDRGVNDPCDLVPEPTRIENSFHVVTGSGVDQATIMEGVTICAGNAYDWPNPGRGREPHWSEFDRGGGIYNEGGHLILRRCVLTLNSANAEGGAIFSTQSGQVALDDCTVTENSSIREGGGIYSSYASELSLSKCRLERNWALDTWGGAICNYRSNASVRQCELRGNVAGHASGLHSYTGQIVVEDCLFEGNRGTSFVNAGDAVIVRCTFTKNSGNRGALDISAPNTVVKNCIFNQNHGNWSGGAVTCGADAVLENCTFHGNYAAADGGAIYCSRRGTLTIRSCILWGNEASEGSQIVLEKGLGQFWGLRVEVIHSLVEGGRRSVQVCDECNLVWGSGNMDADPLFVNAASGDYHLQSQAGHWDTDAQAWSIDDATSPCIDAGDPNSPVGEEAFPNGWKINMGAYGGTAEASKSYFGEPVCEMQIPGDINGDCRVDAEDLAMLARNWLRDERPRSTSPSETPAKRPPR